ncbi:hypothetical protein Mgra_00003651 [Meloidogyne graminicola]|uniref:Uncharacterized protein n=1 Tax=Meloidogyne graminicola TaxID=189291 RepID=A0A8S9ZV96_9BILA|nr:hypothetical protein Mgra_00003651 [Meloidogyne graminicola]
MQYKLYKPPSRFSHPSTNNLPTFKHVGDKEPLMVNTLIQFGPNKGDISESEKQRLSSFMGEEGKSIEQNSPITTPPPNLNGQKRVTINIIYLNKFYRTYVPENQTNSTTNPKIAIVKAFAASNSSQISEAQLREELGKELEQSVSLILDELGRKDKSKQHITSTQPVPNGEELERLEGEENEGQTTERSQKESENSILSTREAITEQQPSSISSSTVPPLLVFSKTKEPIEVLPATSITTAQNKKEEENISTVTPGDNEEQKEEIATTIETQTEENIVESKSTTITIAQLYKNGEEKIESPIATTNAEEIQLTSTKNIKPEENELNKENQETPKEEENKGLVIEGSIIKSEKKTTTTTENWICRRRNSKYRISTFSRGTKSNRRTNKNNIRNITKHRKYSEYKRRRGRRNKRTTKNN